MMKGCGKMVLMVTQWGLVYKLPITIENISSNRFETKNIKLRIMILKGSNLNKPHNSVITYILCYVYVKLWNI